MCTQKDSHAVEIQKSPTSMEALRAAAIAAAGEETHGEIRVAICDSCLLAATCHLFSEANKIIEAAGISMTPQELINAIAEVEVRCGVLSNGEPHVIVTAPLNEISEKVLGTITDFRNLVVTLESGKLLLTHDPACAECRLKKVSPSEENEARKIKERRARMRADAVIRKL